MLFLRSSHPEVFWGKGVLKICNKFIGEHPCRSLISIKLRNKSLFGTGIRQYICCIIWEHLFLDGCFCFLDKCVPVITCQHGLCRKCQCQHLKKAVKKYWRYVSGTRCNILLFYLFIYFILFNVDFFSFDNEIVVLIN